MISYNNDILDHMESFASDHEMMDGFLNFQHNRRKINSARRHTHHNVHCGARSMSLLDRRGLITAPRFPTRKSSISPLNHHKRQDVDSADTLAMLMHLLEKDDGDHPFCTMFLPTMTSTDKSTRTPMIWQHIQRTLPVKPFSQVCRDTNKADEIGHFVIGPQGNSAAVKHWKRIFTNPNTSFSAWHALTSAISFPHKFFNCNLYRK